MAITDTRPETLALTGEPSTISTSPDTVFGSGDHTVLGRLYIGAALLLGVAAWVVNALVGANQLGDGDLLSVDAANTLFTLGRTGLVLFVLAPLLLGIATLIVPLQVGANTVAFPRAAAFAFWTWLIGSGVVIVANAVDGGFGGDRERAVDLMLVSLGAVVLALLVGTACVLTTAIALRTPGMTLDRVPATTWAFVVGGAIWMLSLPVLGANLLLIYLDHRYGLPSEFGLADSQWAQVSWLVSQPQVYAFLIPALGIITDVVTTFAGVRLAHRGFVLVGIGAFGALSFGAFAQPYFYEDVADHAVWAGMSLLIILPTLLLVGAWAATLRAGRPAGKAPVGLAGIAVLLLLLSVIAGGLYAISPLELRESGAFSAGHLALVVATGLAAAAAGLAYWAPKLIGRFANDGLGKLSVLLYLGGGVLAGGPLLVLGFANRFDGLADAADALNGIAVAGSALMVLALLVTIASLATARRGDGLADDAWGNGQSLEWAAGSPPASGNFGELAVVRSPEPVLDAAEPTKEA